MSVRVRCTKCQAAFLVPDDPQGGVVACPKCGARHKTPAARPEPVPSAPSTSAEVDEAASVFRPAPEARTRAVQAVNKSKAVAASSADAFAEAVKLAKACGNKKLILYHHDPTQSDAAVAEKERRARELFPNSEAAREGLVIEL